MPASRAYEITPHLAAEADIPGGLATAYFVGKTTRAQPYNWSDVQCKNKEQVRPLVSFQKTRDGQFELSHWPRGTVAVLLPHEPRATGDLFFQRTTRPPSA